MSEFPPFSFGGFFYLLAVLSVFIVARYFAIAGAVYWALWKRPGSRVHARRLARQAPTAKLMRHEIRWSIVSSLVYAGAGVILIDAWRSGTTKIYVDIGDYGWFYLFASVPLYMFLHDTWFYWTHRLMHRPALFPVMHKVHHESRQPTPWAGFSFHPWEALVGAVIFPVLVMLIPLHIGALLFLLAVMTVTGITNHAGYEILPDSWVRGFVGEHWVSATHHNLHHQNYRSNFGLYFRFWDKLMGTDEMHI